MFVLIFHEDGAVCECEEGVLCFVEFVIPSALFSELFDISEVTLYNVSPFVQIFIRTVLPSLDHPLVERLLPEFVKLEPKISR